MYARTGGPKQWMILGIAVMGLTTATTVLAFFLPLILSGLTDSRAAIGFAGGVEGFAALIVPLLIGPASDKTWNRFGRRMPFMLAATPLIVVGLSVIALLHSYWLILAAVTSFFVGYYVYYTSYQALYPDTLPHNEYGRAWGYQSIFQGAGVTLALLGGGALLTAGTGAPFLAASAFFVIIAGVTFWLIKEHPDAVPESDVQVRSAGKNFLNRLRSDRELRLFLSAHFCWEFTLAAIRAFVILYLIEGLNLTTAQLLPTLAVIIFCYLLAAVISGHIADGSLLRRYLSWMIGLYAFGLLVTGLLTNFHILQGILPFGMFAGAAVLMLAYPVLLRVTPQDRRGEYTGYYQFNRGLALVLGASVTGALIDLLGNHFPETNGYQVMWLVCAVFAALSLWPYLKLSQHRHE